MESTLTEYVLRYGLKLSVGIVLLAPATGVQAMDQQLFAYSGMPVDVPGQSLQIEQLRPPGFVGFNAAPVINATGEIAMWARLEPLGGGSSVGESIWTVNNGVLSPVAVVGDTVPGVPGGTYEFWLSRRIILDNNGNVAYAAEVQTPTDSNLAALLVGGAAQGRTVALEGGTVPQQDPVALDYQYVYESFGTAGALQDPYGGSDFVFNGNNLAYSARIGSPSGPSGGPDFEPALYVERPGFAPTEIDLIARQGADTTFSPQGEIPAISPTTEVLFRTTVMPDDNSGNFTAVATYNQAAVSFIAMSGSNAGGDIGFTNFNNTPGFNLAGQAAFSASFTDLPGASSGIFKSQDPNGVVATDGIVAAGTPDLSNDGTPDFIFNSFVGNQPLLNANGSVLFKHTASTPDNSQTVTGLWSDRTGRLTSLDLIAMEGDPAPGLPAGTVFTSIALNGVGQHAVINANDEVAFLGQAQAPGGPVLTGIWVEVDGVLTLVAATGDTVNLPNSTNFDITTLDFTGGSGNQDGRPSGFSDNSQLVYRADAPGSTLSAYFLFSPFPILPADLDNDGDVDDADFGLAFAAFTGPNSGPSNNPSADLDNDGDVDDADFGLAFAAFTGPGGAANVPEPASVVLLAGMGIWACLRRRFPSD